MEHSHEHESFNLPTHGEVTNYLEALVHEVNTELMGKPPEELRSIKKELLLHIKKFQHELDKEEDERGSDIAPTETVGPDVADQYQVLRGYMALHFPQLDMYISTTKNRKPH